MLYEVESYNPVTNQWTSCPSLNQKKGNLAGVSFNERIYAVGGGNGTECLSAVEIFDLDYERWIPTKSMLHKVDLLWLSLFNASMCALQFFFFPERCIYW